MADEGIGMFGQGQSAQLGYNGGSPSMSPINANFVPQSALIESSYAPQQDYSTPGTKGMAAGTGAAIGAGIGSVVPVLGTAVGAAIGAGVGALIDLGTYIYGSSKQDEANEKNRALAEKWAKIQNEIAAKQSAREWTWLEEEKDYKNALDFQANLDKMLNTDIGLKNSLVTLWRRAA